MDIIYTLNKTHLKLIPTTASYFEVWRGLPDVAFETTTDRARGKLPALVYEQEGNYIWVPPDARKTFIIKAQNTIFVAERQLNAQWYVPWVTAFEDVHKAGKVAIESNIELLTEFARSDEDKKRDLELQVLVDDARQKYQELHGKALTAKRNYETLNNDVKSNVDGYKKKHLAEQESRFEEMLAENG
ncbi:hypothetical protein J4207_00180 [Candidatus Woesearchaeota archaeon]|nr:hypothetical protein [Candidatus Woesearchaeota archaeon]